MSATVPKFNSSVSRGHLSRASAGTRSSKQRLSKSTSFMQFQPMSFEEKLRRYRAIFDSIDVDGSGTLDPEELSQAVVALGLEEDQVSEVFGVSGEFSLSFDEFVNQMEAYEQKLSEELANEEEEDQESDDSMEGATIPNIDIATATAYRRLFDELDVRRAGQLTAEDLHTYIRNLSLRQANISSEELNFLFVLVEQADGSEEGYIEIDTFADIAEMHPEFLENYQKKATKTNPSRNSKYYSTGSAMSAFSVKDVGDEEMQQYRAVFNEFDRNNVGTISDEDVTAMMNKLGRVPTEEESEFLFELLQLVGEDGFTFEEFVELMHEGPEGIAELGKSVSTWKNRQTHKQNVRSKKLVKANVSRMGLRTAIQRENSKIQSRNSGTLERINQRLSRDLSRERPDGFGAGFSFLPTQGNGGGSSAVGGYQGSGVQMYPTSHTASHGGARRGLGFASAMLTPIELLRYQAVFNALDLDKDGRVSFSEMTISTKGVTGRQPSDQEVRQFIQDADTDANGTLEFEEFVVIMQRTKRAMGRMSVPNPEFAQAATHRKMEKYRTVFDSFDTNKDGVVTQQEFKLTLASLGKPADENAIEKMFATYDKSGSGGLNFQDFIPMLDQMVAKELSL